MDEATRTGNEMRVQMTRLRVAERMLRDLAVNLEYWKSVKRDAEKRVKLLTMRSLGYRQDERQRAEKLAGGLA